MGVARDRGVAEIELHGLPFAAAEGREPVEQGEGGAAARPALDDQPADGEARGRSSGGPLARLRDGDVVKVCAVTGALSTTADLDAREPAPDPRPDMGTGRELFGMMRRFADGAEQGASAMLATGGM